MADLKITGLPALVEAGVQNVDVLALADLSANETKKITVKDLVAAGVALIDDGDIPAAKVGTLGTNQVATGAIQDGAVSNVKLANSSISLGGVSIALGATDATPAFNLADGTGYLTTNLSGTITNAQLAGSIAGTKLLDTTITYAKLNLSDGDIPGAKIATGGITATQLAANSVTASELADDAVDTAAIADGAVVAASIATDTITSNQIAANAITASELADNAVDAGAIAADAVTTVKISNASVTAAKLAADLPGTILATGAIGSTQLAANSVTASELADNAVDSGAIAASAVIDAKIASGIGGAKITDGTITAAKLATANIDRSLNVASGNLGINNTVVAATRSGITYNAQGLITATVALAASDLPLATTSAVGAVSVGTGLAVTGAGALSLSNSVTAATISGITYNAQGQITATTALVAGDLPAATTSAKGAVLITSGGGISVDGSGAISTSTSGITAGTYAKVTVNNKGVATAGTSLVAGDIPSLAATKITSGTFDVGRFGTNTILGSKFADSSVCQFTGAQSTSGVVTFPTAEFKGQFFYDLTNDDLYVYDGSAFQPVTITSGEIIYAGNYRADTNKITSLTAAGTAQGFTQNAALQAASAANNRYYFVCDKSGTGTSPAPTVTINPPDMILSNGASWEKLDISNFIAGQVASNIGVTATGGIQNTNVQSVLEELDTEKLNLTGGTLTGNLALNQSSSIIFEGSTPDDFETTLTVIDPTADRTVSLPNVTGTLVSTGDSGSVTSTMILDGTILNADINASAAIALTKLANVTAAHIIVGNASNVPTAVAITGDISISNAGLVAITADSIVNADIKSDAAISGSKIVAGTTSVVGVVQLTDSAASSSTTTAATPAAVKVAKDAADAAATTANAALATTGGTLTNNLIIDNAKQIRFTEADANGANFVSLQAPDTLAADVSYTLPSAAPTANGQVLAGTTAGVLSWTDDPTGQWVTNGNDVNYTTGNVLIGTSTWQFAKKLNVQGSTGAILSLSNFDTTTYAQDTNASLELKLKTGNTGNESGACEIRAFKENGTNGDNARGLSFWTAGNGGANAAKLTIASTGDVTLAGHIQFSGTASSLTNISQPIITRSGSDSGSYPFNGYGHLILQARGDGTNRDIILATGTNGANKTIFDASGNASFVGNVTMSKASPVLRLSDTTDPQGADGSIGKIEFYGSDGSSGGADVRSYIQTISTNAVGNAHALVIGLGIQNAAPTEKLRISDNGELKITGTGDNNDPAHIRLHHPDTSIVADDRIGQIRFAGQDSGGATESRTGALIQATAAATWDTGQASGYAATHLDFFTQANSGTDTVAAGARLRIAADGKVGIGTQSPDELLDVRDGDIILSSTNAGSAHRTSFIEFTGSYARINSVSGQGSTAASNYAAGWNFTTRNYTGSAFETLTPLTIQANGNVGINNTSPTVKLAVDGGTTSDATVVQIKNDSTSAYSASDGGLNTALSLFSDGTDAAQGVGIQLYLQKSGETGCISEVGAVRESNGNSSLVFRTRDSSTGVNERMRLDSSGRMGLGLLNPHSYYANQLVIKCPSEGGMTLRNTGANDWNYIMFASGDSSSTRYSGWIGYDHADNKLKVAVNDDVSGKGFGFLNTGNFEIQQGDLQVSTGAGVRANGPNNSTYGELKIQVDVPDGSGNNNVATFKKATPGIVLAFPSGGGIDFSATSDGSGSAGSELLSDYEEGTWTPANTHLAITNNSTARYTKIGRLVTVMFDVTYAASPSDTSPVGGRISGLPFEPVGIATHFTPTILNAAGDDIQDNATSNFITYVEVSSNNRIIFYSIDQNGEATRSLLAGKRVRGSVTYTT